MTCLMFGLLAMANIGNAFTDDVSNHMRFAAGVAGMWCGVIFLIELARLVK